MYKRQSLWRLIRQQTLFTFLECIDITIPTTNNRIEGGVNAQLRSMLRAHRGLSLERRLKAVSYTHLDVYKRQILWNITGSCHRDEYDTHGANSTESCT